MFRVIRFIVIGSLACVARDQRAEAGLFHHDEGTPPPGRFRYIAHTDERAGVPRFIGACAHPPNTPDYVAYYVGGGTGHMGCDRRVEEGTWGRDYGGIWLPRHVRLQWSHGRLYQGGTGQYDPDGHPIPDVIGLTAAKLRSGH
jgi:hypothetical protein